MSALQRRTRAVRKPSAVASAIDALRDDLEVHRNKAVAIEALIGRLAAYSGAEEFPAIDSVTTPVRRRRRGRLPADAGDALRAKKRDAMRRRRARLKAEAAAKPPASPPPKAKPRKKEKAAPIEQKVDTAADAPSPKTNGSVPRKQRKPQRLRKDAGVPISGVRPLAGEWTTAPDGTLSRELVAPGEAVPLKLV